MGDSASARLFLALMLGDELGARVASVVGEALGPVRRTDPADNLRRYGARELHLTLFFLGNVSLERRELLEAALAETLEGRAAPVLRIGAAGTFPAAGRPRILWLEVRETSRARLEPLVAASTACCEGQGFLRDPRPFAAHLTVARARRGPRGGAPEIPPAFFELDPGVEWKPPSAALVQTLPGGAAVGGAYRVVREFPLARPDA